MVLKKVYAYTSYPSAVVFLGDFTELESVKAVIKGFNDLQYPIIEDKVSFENAQTFEELKKSALIKIISVTVGESKDPANGTLQW